MQNNKGQNLKVYRESRGLTPKQMAEALEISPSYYYKIEKGVRPPTYAVLKKFKAKFQAVVDGFLI